MIKGGDNDSTHTQVIPEGVAEEAKRILETVVTSGTGTHADIGAAGQWGKTGTTENNGDAWFCGGVDDEVTACVWVGYADTTTPMTTLYNGGPVMGGTFPALIWASVISAWEDIKAERAAEAKEGKHGGSSSGSGSTTHRRRRPKRSLRTRSKRTVGTGAPEPAEPEPPNQRNRRPPNRPGAAGRNRRLALIHRFHPPRFSEGQVVATGGSAEPPGLLLVVDQPFDALERFIQRRSKLPL